MKIKFKKLHIDAKKPKKMRMHDAGFDLTAVEMEHRIHSKTLPTGLVCDVNIVTYSFGLAVQIPKGYSGLLVPRSSVYKTGMTMSNCAGVIDSGYRGEIKANFYPNETNKDLFYKPGDRIAQLIILPVPDIEFVEVDELEDSQRGIGGFGSTDEECNKYNVETKLLKEPAITLDEGK